MRYIPLTQADREAMLRVIGASATEELFSSVPQEIRRRSPLALPSQKSERELRSYFLGLANKNIPVESQGWLSFLGAGCYDHFIPTVVDALASRGEFVTAYTPYQPEVSQGTLQAIFEFQSMISNLMSLEAANASMYDGASAVAEAVLMAMRIRKGDRAFVSRGLHPEYRETLRSYLSDAGIEIIDLEINAAGQTLPIEFPKGTVAVVVSQPNFYGVVEDLEPMAEAIHDSGGLLVVAATEAMAFGLLKGPGSLGADIVAGEGQSFGNPQTFGGPHVGILATRNEFIRQMPGRLVGKTLDQEGRDGYVLTLSTREQHIRRERATSNICTNHSLCALRACIYMATMGERGLREVATRNAWAAHRLRSKLSEIEGVAFPYSGPFFNEFVIRLPISTEAFMTAMEKEKILAGIPLSKWDKSRPNDLLLAVTETKGDGEIARYVESVRRVL